MNKVQSSDSLCKRPESIFIGVLKIIWYWIIIYSFGLKAMLIQIFTPHKVFNTEEVEKRKGEIVVITGGARGFAVEVVRKLLYLEMHVIIGARDVEKGNKVLKKIIEEDKKCTGSGECIKLDLLSLNSVREFATTILGKEKPIQVLINCAGVMFVPFQLSEDGFESHFQVNYLSHFLLTYLLLPRLASSGTLQRASRVVNIASCTHEGASINFSDLQTRKLYARHMVYMRSKLMQITSSNDLNGRCESIGAHVKCISIHPGFVKTELFKHTWYAQMFIFFLGIFFKRPAQGADGICYGALSPRIESEGGIYLYNSRKFEPNPRTKNPEIQKKLWNISCELVNVDKILNL